VNVLAKDFHINRPWSQGLASAMRDMKTASSACLNTSFGSATPC